MGRQPASEVLTSPWLKQWMGPVCMVRLEVLRMLGEEGSREVARRAAFSSWVLAGG